MGMTFNVNNEQILSYHQMGMTEEMMNDTLDDLLTESGDEEEQDAIVNQVHFMMLAPLEPTSYQQYLM